MLTSLYYLYTTGEVPPLISETVKHYPNARTKYWIQVLLPVLQKSCYSRVSLLNRLHIID